MKTCGIFIDSNIMRFVILKKEKDGTISLLDFSNNFFELKDTSSSLVLKEFTEVVHSFITEQAPDKIAILARKATGKMASSGITFKIEASIQLHPTQSIELIAKSTIDAYIRKSPHQLKTKHKNQIECLNLAYFLISNKS